MSKFEQYLNEEESRTKFYECWANSCKYYDKSFQTNCDRIGISLDSTAGCTTFAPRKDNK